jgi:hypothetical protein
LRLPLLVEVAEELFHPVAIRDDLEGHAGGVQSASASRRATNLQCASSAAVRGT